MIILPDGKWDVVLADPPWSYTGPQDKWGAAAKFYDTITDSLRIVTSMRFFVGRKKYRRRCSV